MTELENQLEVILSKFRTGDLQEEDILGAISQVSRKPVAQGLLYIQTAVTHPHAAVMGISIYEDGKDPDGLDENGNLLYKSLKEALDDGWRILKFPEMALAMDEQNNYGLGYEFILERWRN